MFENFFLLLHTKKIYKKLLTVDSTTSNCNIIRLVYIEQVYCCDLIESYFNDYLCDIFFSDFILLHNSLGCHCQEKIAVENVSSELLKIHNLRVNIV